MKFLAGFLCLASLSVAADAPTAESLIRKCVEAEGGAAAVRKMGTAVITGHVEMVGHNIGGPLEIYQDGGRMYTMIDLPGLGKIEEGFNGEVAWESSSIQGARVKDGEELAATRRASIPSLLADWKKYYKSARTMGEDKVAGKLVWHVEMIPTEGGTEHIYFDRETGLQVKSSEVLKTAMGDIPVETTMEDYRLVDGVRTPFLTTENAMGQILAMHVEKVTYGAAIPKEKFELPAQVKALLAKKP